MEEYTTSRYKLVRKIGEGVHGVVIQALDIPTNKYVAIKKVSLRNKHGDISLNTLREIKILQTCSSDFILELKDLFADLSGLSLVFEYMPFTLSAKLKPEALPLNKLEVKLYANMLFQGLQYLHSRRLMHRILELKDLFADLSGLSLVFEYMPFTLSAKLKPEALPLNKLEVKLYANMLF